MAEKNHLAITFTDGLFCHKLGMGWELRDKKGDKKNDCLGKNQHQCKDTEEQQREETNRISYGVTLTYRNQTCLRAERGKNGVR